jgi:hypothetical protein
MTLTILFLVFLIPGKRPILPAIKWKLNKGKTDRKEKMNFKIKDKKLKAQWKVDENGDLELMIGDYYILWILRNGELFLAESIPKELGLELDERGRLKI